MERIDEYLALHPSSLVSRQPDAIIDRLLGDVRRTLLKPRRRPSAKLYVLEPSAKQNVALLQVATLNVAELVVEKHGFEQAVVCTLLHVPGLDSRRRARRSGRRPRWRSLLHALAVENQRQLPGVFDAQWTRAMYLGKRLTA
jgi:hypothetical protein